MNRLRELRKKKGITQAVVAKCFGIDRTTLTKYETGQSEPSNDMLQRLAEYYGVTIGYILGAEENPQPFNAADEDGLTEDQLQLLRIFDGMDEEQQKSLLRLVESAAELNRK